VQENFFETGFNPIHKGEITYMYNKFDSIKMFLVMTKYAAAGTNG